MSSHAPRKRRWLAVVATLAVSTLPSAASAAPTGPNELSHDITAPTTCDNCHQFANPAANAGEPAIAPYDSWRGSLMANAARDPVFWAGIAIASQDHADETELCIRCHSPRAFLEGRGDAIAIEELQPDDYFSVECELCHRMMDEGNIGNAQYTIDDVQVGGNVPRRGPWTYAGQDPPHSWLQDDYIGSSELCGTCHDVTTPRTRVDDDGASLGMLFNEQRTYSEWLGSDYAAMGATFADCQDCHMPALTDVSACQQYANDGMHPTGGRRHDLAGANRFVVQLLQQTYGDAGTGEVSDAAYDHTLARIDEVLATAATLEVTAPAAVDLGAGFDLDVRVTNHTGHKLPTGYSEGRVMWLEIVAEYAGQTLYSSGAWQGGEIEADAQLRTYRGDAQEWATGTSQHLLLNDHWLEDTRIPPLGLVPNVETDPVGDRYTLLPNGTWPNYDDVAYAFAPTLGLPDATPLDPTDDELQITVRLRYLVNTPEYIEFLEDANVTNDAGVDVAAMFAAQGGAPAMVLAESIVLVPLAGFDDEGGSSSDGGITTNGTTTDGTTSDGTTTGDGTSSAGESSESGSMSTAMTADTTRGSESTAADTTGTTADTNTGTTGTDAGTTTDAVDTTGSGGASQTASASDATDPATADDADPSGSDSEGEGEGGLSDDSGCGCTSSAQPRGAAPWLVLALACIRRRRSGPALTTT